MRWVLIVLVMLWLGVGFALAQTRPTTTDDLLDQINAIPAATQPVQRKPAPDPAAPLESPETIHWGGLIHLFGPMLATSAALGLAGGVLGIFVLLRREALVALAMPQIVAVGAAIGLREGWPTLPPAMIAAAVGLLYFVMSRKRTGSWLLPALYIGGLSLSFVIIANHGQDVEDLQHLFVGVDVAVSPATALLAVPILLLAAAMCAMLWRRWLLLAQAPSAGELAGLRPWLWDALFLFLLTVVLVLGTNSVGVVMVLGMLFLPAATVLPWSRRIPEALAASAMLSVLFLCVGFYLSNTMPWPMSQSVGSIGFVTLLVSYLANQLRGFV